MAPKKLSKKDETEIAQALAKFKRDLPDDVDTEKVEDLVKAHQAELVRTYQQKKKKRKACEAPCAAIATDVDTCIFADSDDTKTNLQYYSMVEADILVIQEKIPGITTMEPLPIVDATRGDRCGVQAGALSSSDRLVVVLHGRCLPVGGCRPVVPPIITILKREVRRGRVGAPLWLGRNPGTTGTAASA